MGIHDTAGDQREGVLLLTHDDGVAGVVAPLEPDHDVGVLCEEVSDATLAFVAPLGTQDNGGRHAASVARSMQLPASSHQHER